MIDDVAITHEPILITSKRNNVILLSEQDWAAVQETLYLLSIPGIRESIREGMNTDLAECNKELDW